MDDLAPPDASLELIRAAVAGDHKAMRQLVRDLTPAIRSGVMSVLARAYASGRREGRQELEDITQTVLLALFADRARVLLEWTPDRGLDLPSYVSMLARREVVSVLRSRRRSPWTEDPTRNEDLDQNAAMRMGPESEAISKDMLAALSGAVRERLSARGAEIFDLMFLQGLPPEEVADQTGMSFDAIYAWKSRLTRQLREIFADLAATPPTIPPPAATRDRDKTGPMPRVPAAGRTGLRLGAPRVPTKTGPMPVVRRLAGPRRRVAGGSSAPPPPSER